MSLSRRNFLKTAGLVAAAPFIPDISSGITAENTGKNPLPRWKGFNILDYFSPRSGGNPNGTTEDDFRWMRDWGFNFVRLPMAYPGYLDIDRTRNITPEDVYQN